MLKEHMTMQLVYAYTQDTNFTITLPSFIIYFIVLK